MSEWVVWAGRGAEHGFDGRLIGDKQVLDRNLIRNTRVNARLYHDLATNLLIGNQFEIAISIARL